MRTTSGIYKLRAQNLKHSEKPNAYSIGVPREIAEQIPADGHFVFSLEEDGFKYTYVGDRHEAPVDAVVQFV